MDAKANLNNISSRHALKLVFLYSNMKYKTIYDLIKYNKDLQNKLGIISGRKIYLNYKYITGYRLEYLPCFQMLTFIFILVYASIAAAKGTFDSYNTKTNFDKSKKEFIIKVNYSLFGYTVFLVIQMAFFYLLAAKAKFKVNNSYFNKIYFLLFTIIYIFFVLLDLSYYIIYCIKMNYAFKILREDLNTWKKYPWFISFDIFIIIILSYQNIQNILSLFQFAEKKEDERIYFLKQFRDIKIEDYKLCGNFGNLDIIEKNNVILNNSRSYIYKLTTEEVFIIYLINEIRNQYKAEKLAYSLEEKIPDLILNENEYKEILFDECKNFFTISSNEYLFRDTKENFKKALEKKDPNILNIIIKKSLKKIIIIEKRNTEYILISGDTNNTEIQIRGYNLNSFQLDSESNFINDINQNIDN